MATNQDSAAAAKRNAEFDEELAGVLTAISVISKRLAKRLVLLQAHTDLAAEGANLNDN